MPIWLIQLIVTLAVKFGVPFILKRFPSIPAEVIKIIEELIAKLTDQKAEKQVLIAEAKQKVKAICEGPHCELK